MSDTIDKTVFSKAHRAHISESLKGKPKTPEHKAKIAEGMRRKAEQRAEQRRMTKQDNSVTNR